MLKMSKKENKARRVLIFGYDGTGKSHFAEKYCKNNSFKSVVFDFDDTNFESNNILNLNTGMPAFRLLDYIKRVFAEVQASEEYDTVVFDGIGTLFDLFIGKGKGLSKYSERAEYWKELRRLINSSPLNIIFIGQIDADIKMQELEENKPSKLLIQLHSIVDEKYLCTFDETAGFKQFVLKYRCDNTFVGKLYNDVKDEIAAATPAAVKTAAAAVESVVAGQKEYEEKKLKEVKRSQKKK